MTDLLRDVRGALRSVRRDPGTTATIVLSLALGIGAVTTLFTYVASMVWPTVDAPQPEELVVVQAGTEEEPGSLVSLPDYRALAEWTERHEPLELSAARLPVSASIAIPGREAPAFAFGFLVSGHFFDLFGKAPLHGRWLSPRDDRPGAPRAIVLGYPFFRRHFGADPEVIGRTLTLEGAHRYTVVGVARPGFQASGWVMPFYVPLAHWRDLSHDLDDPGRERLSVLGRLADGTTRDRAEDALAGLARGLDAAHPRDSPRTLSLSPMAGLEAGFESPMVRRAKILMGLTALLLLLAAANVANLLLARGVDRRREVAVRAALGAGRWRLVRRLAIEGLLLSIFAAALGTALARWATLQLEPLIHYAPIGFATWGEGSEIFVFDLRMPAFALVVAAVLTVVFAAAPALELLRRDLVTPLKSDAVGAPGAHAGGGPRKALVVVQVAFGVTLLIVGVLLARSLGEIRSTEPGFDTDDLLLAAFYLPDPSGGGQEGGVERLRTYTHVVDRLRAVPGVEGAALAARPPLFGGSYGERVRVPGRTEGATEVDLAVNMVGVDYFETLGLPILRGRGFDRRDRSDGAGTVVVNRTLAERFWPDADPLDQRLVLVPGRTAEEAGRSFRVVGVVADSRYADLETPPEPLAYFPVAQRPLRRMTAVLRTAPGAGSSVPDDVRAAVADEHPTLAVVEIVPFDEELGASLFEERIHGLVAGAVGAIGLALTAIGLAALVAFSVSRRSPEIAIRMALGARVRDAVTLVVREAAVLVGIGLALGVGGAVAFGRVIRSLLYGVGPLDPPTLAVVALVVPAVALAAALLPARRAARVDPARAMRRD